MVKFKHVRTGTILKEPSDITTIRITDTSVIFLDTDNKLIMSLTKDCIKSIKVLIQENERGEIV